MLGIGALTVTRNKWFHMAMAVIVLLGTLAMILSGIGISRPMEFGLRELLEKQPAATGNEAATAERTARARWSGSAPVSRGRQRLESADRSPGQGEKNGEAS